MRKRKKLSHNIEKIYGNLKTKDDFVLFLVEFSNYYKDCKEANVPWSNNDIESFFFAAARCLDDIEGYFKNVPEDKMDLENVHWKLFASILFGGIEYE